MYSLRIQPSGKGWYKMQEASVAMELRNCHKAEIYDLMDQPVCEAEVTRASYEGYRLIVPQDFEMPEETALFNVTFYDGFAGLVHTVCVLSDALNISKEKQSLMCVVREEKGNDQRRSDLKIPAVMSIDVSCVRRPSGSDPKLRLPARIPAKTVNISAGGVYFSCGVFLPVDSHVQFQLHESDKPLQLTAKVLRVDEGLEPDRSGKPQFGYGCQFINLKSQAEAELRRYIFRKEIELRRKTR